MEQYMKKPGFVDADVYTDGMEDGFTTRYVRKDDSGRTCGHQNDKYTIPVTFPYIRSDGGMYLINSGDYVVVTHKAGVLGNRATRIVMSPASFHETYEKVRNDCKMVTGDEEESE